MRPSRRPNRGRAWTGWFAVAAVATAITPAGWAAQASYSPAQVALFETDHLKNITRPTTLDYDFEHRGGTAGDFTDKVSEEIRDIHPDGKKDVWITFLTGDHQVKFPPAIGFHGNPMLMYFLENDVREMHMATGGSARYFRDRIRQSFLDGAEMHPAQFNLDGKQEQGTEITVAPFRHDPNIAKFATFADKTYRFVLSPAVPGGIYSIATSVPALEGKPTPFAETMTYAGEHS